jgi:hypothetical protein
MRVGSLVNLIPFWLVMPPNRFVDCLADDR